MVGDTELSFWGDTIPLTQEKTKCWPLAIWQYIR